MYEEAKELERKLSNLLGQTSAALTAEEFSANTEIVCNNLLPIISMIKKELIEIYGSAMRMWHLYQDSIGCKNKSEAMSVYESLNIGCNSYARLYKLYCVSNTIFERAGVTHITNIEKFTRNFSAMLMCIQQAEKLLTDANTNDGE